MDQSNTPTAADNTALLTGLLDTADAPQLAPVAVGRSAAAAPAVQRSAAPAPAVQRSVAPAPATARAQPRQQPTAGPFKADGLYDKLGTTGALIFALAISAGLWWVGAYFSLQALAGWGVALAGAGPAAWLIPLAVSLAELWLWPAGRRVRPLLGVWACIVAFDVGTTAAGLLTVLAGKHLPLFTGYDIPTGGPVLVAISIGIGALCAFGPEKLGRGTGELLYELWQPAK